MDTKLLSDVARDFSAVDFTAENDKITAIEAQIFMAEEQIVAADERCREIARTTQEWRGPAGSDVADALMGGATVLEAARAGPDLAALEAERDTLRAAMRDLRHRVEDWRAEISLIETNARQRLAGAAQRLLEGVNEDARTAASALATAYACAEAISAATRFGSVEAHNLRRLVQEASKSGGPLPYALRDVEVPADLMATLATLQGKGKALRIGVIDRAPV